MCRQAEELIDLHGPDYPWHGVRSVLGRGDLRIANLETPLCEPGPIHYPLKLVHLRSSAPPATLSLRNAGFNLVSLANNHLLDYGPQAMMSTIETLDQAGIKHAGAGRNETEARGPVFLDIAGRRIAFLSFCSMPPTAYGARDDRPGTAFIRDEDEVLAEIRAAKARADLVLVAMHWGRDYIPFAPARNRRLGRACIDAGAALVIGHHPHVLQGIEVYRGGLIAYSLGNFVFGNGANPRYGAILEAELAQDGLARVTIHPVGLHAKETPHQPRLLHGPEGERALGVIARLSGPFGTIIEGGKAAHACGIIRVE